MIKTVQKTINKRDTITNKEAKYKFKNLNKSQFPFSEKPTCLE